MNLTRRERGRPHGKDSIKRLCQFCCKTRANFIRLPGAARKERLPSVRLERIVSPWPVILSGKMQPRQNRPDLRAVFYFDMSGPDPGQKGRNRRITAA